MQISEHRKWRKKITLAKNYTPPPRIIRWCPFRYQFSYQIKNWQQYACSILDYSLAVTSLHPTTRKKFSVIVGGISILSRCICFVNFPSVFIGMVQSVFLLRNHLCLYVAGIHSNVHSFHFYTMYMICKLIGIRQALLNIERGSEIFFVVWNKFF